MDPNEEQTNDVSESQDAEAQEDQQVSTADAVDAALSGEEMPGVNDSDDDAEEGDIAELGDAGQAEGEAKPEGDAEKLEAEAEAVKPDANEKPADGEEYEMPKDLSGNSKKRFTHLVENNKELKQSNGELTEKFEQTTAQLNDFRELINDSTSQPQEFVALLDYSKAVKTGNFDEAITLLQAQAQMLAVASGKTVTLNDPLAQYPDLRDQVEDMAMDESAALEVARARASQQAQQQAQQQQQDSQQQVQQAQQQQMQAKQKIDAWAVEQAQKDINWPAKEKILLEKLPEIQRNFPIEQWSNQLQFAYSMIASSPQAPTARTPAPLRSSGLAAGPQVATDTLSAINLGCS